MNEPRDRDAQSQLEFLRVLVEEHASIDGDILEIRKDVWIIHGIFPYDGEVPMAVFNTRDEAQRVLDQFCGFQPVEEL